MTATASMRRQIRKLLGSRVGRRSGTKYRIKGGHSGGSGATKRVRAERPRAKVNYIAQFVKDDVAESRDPASHGPETAVRLADDASHSTG